jgi:hypothetical protein
MQPAGMHDTGRPARTLHPGTLGYRGPAGPALSLAERLAGLAQS